MSSDSVAQLIDRLAADARPVRPLRSPAARAAALLGGLGLVGAAALAVFGNTGQLIARYEGRELLMALEMGAMLATGLLAVTGAFAASIPGRSRLWLFAPLPTFVGWLLLSGVGCLAGSVQQASSDWQVGHSRDCLFFILAVSLAIGAPLVWRLSHARPINPVPVALLGGLGSAALAGFLLQFFHPFAVTFADLAVHLLAVGLVIGIAGFLGRRTLAPA